VRSLLIAPHYADSGRGHGCEAEDAGEGSLDMHYGFLFQFPRNKWLNK
jgi:hypothetical protein